jgi:aryl-alcohol dehydrogenase-like predicted oxidoreductase
MKLGLGTVQFGLPYGVTNMGGQVPEEEAWRILDCARRAAIDLFDTAPAYGVSEVVLGEYLAAHEIASPVRIVSKTLPVRSASIGDAELARVQEAFLETLRKLRRSRIYGLLVHHADDLLLEGGAQLYGLLRQWKAEGKVEKIGISAYTASQIEAVLSRYPIDLVQLPVSIVDQRLLKDGLLQKIKRDGVEIHARSIFLQGVLLATPGQLPSMLAPLRPVLERLDAESRKIGLSRLAAALGFIQTLSEINYAIVGALSLAQLESIVSEISNLASMPFPLSSSECAAFGVDDTRLVSPLMWK